MIGRAALIVALLASPALAEDGSLRGRIVTFHVLTYDDPARPIFEGRGETVAVGDGVEFGLLPEGMQNGVDVAPVRVDIGPRRIEVAYQQAMGELVTARFNGYVLRFETDCALFAGVRIDPAATNIPLLPDAVSIDGGTLMINVSGLRYTGQSRFALDLDVADCPMS